MKDVVLDIVKEELLYIDEKSYQQIKRNMCKSDDYFTENELKNCRNFVVTYM